MATIIINGKTISAADGTNVLEAALRNGIYIRAFYTGHHERAFPKAALADFLALISRQNPRPR